MLRKLFIFFTAFLLTGSLFWNCEASDSQTHKLLPVDEGAGDPSFKTFRDQLLKAVKERNIGFVKGILDLKIVLSYPDDEGKTRKFGITDFMNMWQPDNDHSPLWETLETILSMGGTFVDKEQYVTPYIYSLWPKDTDPSECSVIVGKNINVREHPNLNAEVITQLSHDIVKVDHTSSRGKWEKIIMADSKEGYVFGEFIRSKYDWTAGFAKVGSKWIMKWFVSKERSRRMPDLPDLSDPDKPERSEQIIPDLPDLLPPNGEDSRQHSHE